MDKIVSKFGPVSLRLGVGSTPDRGHDEHYIQQESLRVGPHAGLSDRVENVKM